MSPNNTITVELYLLCFNEEKMIRHTLNYYSKFCSKITIIDNQSTDDSMRLASTYKNVVFKSLDSGNEFVEDKLTASKNNCWKGSTADYVIVCDMDEFLYDENLQEKLVQAKQQNIILPAVMGYNMMSHEFPADYKKGITEQVKHGVRSERFDKQIIFDPKKIKEINYRPGAHLCNPVFYENSNVDSRIELKLLHYKYLGKDYVYKKHKVYVNRMSEISRKKKHGYEYLEGEAHVDYMFESAKSVKRIIK
ncbi:glycosyltransferase family 2 protein [Flavobacterium cheongpyeongense]|uniref:glycosyltransferase family 2 protein n=1 Tax=Flavobacterium cheongpyeongense TaxID=2212651 RepID=UPI001E63E1B1|nr:glycosyltransferase family 2 protein [Flavobacterium cheongpyeongense]